MGEVGEWQDHLFLAMTYLDGPSLHARLRNGPLPVHQAIDIATQICRGLEEAHGKGLLHRDIKPGNLIISYNGLVRIVDFGLAWQPGDDHLTAVGTVVGTPVYMAPEQWQPQKVDHRADLWAVGIVLYEMLCGRQIGRAHV